MSYLDERRLARGDGWTLKDWREECCKAGQDIDRLRAEVAAAKDEAEKAKAELKATREYAETSDEQSDLRLQTILDLERKLATLAAEVESLRADKARLECWESIIARTRERNPDGGGIILEAKIPDNMTFRQATDAIDAARADAARKPEGK